MVWTVKASNAVLASKSSGVGQHPHAGHEQAQGPVTGSREVVAALLREFDVGSFELHHRVCSPLES